MPQFSITQMFVSVTLMATGWGMLALLYQTPLGHSWLPVVLWFSTGPLIGAGVFNFFKLPRTGALLGFCMQIAATAMMSEPAGC